MKKLKSRLTLAKVVEFLDNVPLVALRMVIGTGLGGFLSIFAIALLRRIEVQTPASILAPFTIWSTVISCCLPILFWGHIKVVIRNRLSRKPKLKGHPHLAERLLWFFLKAEIAQDGIDHINEQHEMHREQRGALFAWSWYWWQVVRLAWPLLKELIGIAIKWAIWAWISR